MMPLVISDDNCSLCCLSDCSLNHWPWILENCVYGTNKRENPYQEAWVSIWRTTVFYVMFGPPLSFKYFLICLMVWIFSPIGVLTQFSDIQGQWFNIQSDKHQRLQSSSDRIKGVVRVTEDINQEFILFVILSFDQYSNLYFTIFSSFPLSVFQSFFHL